jgi:hypothetical protein
LIFIHLQNNEDDDAEEENGDDDEDEEEDETEQLKRIFEEFNPGIVGKFDSYALGSSSL